MTYDGPQRLPTPLVCGAQDNIVPVSAGEEYHRRIPGSRLEIIQNCGHRSELESTDQFVSLVGGSSPNPKPIRCTKRTVRPPARRSHSYAPIGRVSFPLWTLFPNVSSHGR